MLDLEKAQRRVFALRERKGWSQKKLGELAGVHANTVAKFERGADIRLTVFGRICTALGTTAARVLR